MSSMLDFDLFPFCTSKDSSDVIMCGVDPVTGVVGIVDAYNVVGYNSVRDSTQVNMSLD